MLDHDDLVMKRMLAGSTAGPPCAKPNCEHDSCWAIADDYWRWMQGDAEWAAPEGEW